MFDCRLRLSDAGDTPRTFIRTRLLLVALNSKPRRSSDLNSLSTIAEVVRGQL